MLNHKGTQAEFQFAVECAKRNWVVSSPFNDVAPYDFIIDTGETLKKVQIKGTFQEYRKRKGSYMVGASRSTRSGLRINYDEKEVDLMALYVEPKGVWYIIPTGELGSTTVSVWPDKSTCNFRKYMNAWDLMDNG